MKKKNVLPSMGATRKQLDLYKKSRRSMSEVFQGLSGRQKSQSAKLNDYKRERSDTMASRAVTRYEKAAKAAGGKFLGFAKGKNGTVARIRMAGGGVMTMPAGGSSGGAGSNGG